MNVLPGFNKTAVHGAHSINTTCNVSNPEIPTGPPMNKIEAFDPTILNTGEGGWGVTFLVLFVINIILAMLVYGRNFVIGNAFRQGCNGTAQLILTSDTIKDALNVSDGTRLQQAGKRINNAFWTPPTC